VIKGKAGLYQDIFGIPRNSLIFKGTPENKISLLEGFFRQIRIIKDSLPDQFSGKLLDFLYFGRLSGIPSYELGDLLIHLPDQF
jgi:hypothetical protein